jgi:hypothetical protein
MPMRFTTRRPSLHRSRALRGAIGALLLATMCHGAAAQTSACAQAVQGHIAFDGKKNTTWTDANLSALCQGAERSTEPGACFNQVMTSRTINWGGGTTWVPGNALRLCAGSTNTQQRLSCFQSQVANRVSWSKAVEECVRAERGGAQTAKTLTAPAPTAAAVTATAPDDSLAKKQLAEFTCKGPLELEYLTSGSAPAITNDFVLHFVGAESATSVQPGQCWRAGGWGFARSLGERRAGRLLLSYPLGNCPMLQAMKLSNGRISEFKVTTQGNGGKFAERMLEAATNPGHTLSIGTRFLFGPNVGTAGATYEVYAAQGDIYKPERCN